jgi:plastocyanin
MPLNTVRFVAASILLSASTLPVLAQEAAAQLVIKDHRFQPAEVRVPAGQPFTLRVRNADPTPEEFESKTLRVERVIPGNSETTFQMRALQPGRYKFFGEFHEATAQGALVVQ